MLRTLGEFGIVGMIDYVREETRETIWSIVSSPAKPAAYGCEGVWWASNGGGCDVLQASSGN